MTCIDSGAETEAKWHRFELREQADLLEALEPASSGDICLGKSDGGVDGC